MPSTRPAHIPLDTFPFLGSRPARNVDIFTDQPALTRSPLGSRNHDELPAPVAPIIEPRWRLYLYNLLERPNSSPAAVLVHVLITVLIVFSALITILETVPAFHSLPGGMWFGIETSLVALFTVEYIARCAATSFSWSAFFGWAGCTFSFSCRSVSFDNDDGGDCGGNDGSILSLSHFPPTSVPRHHGPSRYPALLHRSRHAEGYRQSPFHPHAYPYLIRVVSSLLSFAFPYFARSAYFASSVRSGTIIPFYCMCLSLVFQRRSESCQRT